ncbi:methyltransferase [Leucobacter massiliensis]|uniref:Methyltransferase n=1 Tax=Leucobacter massiliensis TaxID=1686285 RepID=A0A2S9QQY4_9MICO|nr:methyltransferase [Leucobacter massiliensis]PRI11982.1 methyltransferase [Leucobacter massiliensis]
MDAALIDRLRGDLDAADYRADTVASLLGDGAESARLRGVFAPARRLRERETLAERRPLAALIRILLLGEALSEGCVERALPRLGAAGAIELGLLAPDRTGALRAALSLNPVEIADASSQHPRRWWILSDLDDQLRLGPARPDHVMGVGGATRSLIGQAPLHRLAGESGDASLDLGTGCGIVALHLAAAGSARVVATDISERALTLARANARLNGLADRIDFRHGDLFAPVAEERFALILSNPPFVISPRGSEAPVYEYRDGGVAGDGLAERVVREAPARLGEGGEFLCLANWESHWGVNGLERVRAWIAAAAEEAGPLDAWVIERDRVDPARYAETWARDGGARPGSEDFDALMNAWLADFALRRTVAVGLGSVRVRRAEAWRERGVVHVEQAAGAYWSAEAPGRALSGACDAGIAAALMSDAEALAARWLLDPAVSEERTHRPGEEAPRAITLGTDRPIARRVTADPLLAAAIGACDGELTLAQIADALATLLEVDPGAAAEALVASARELAWFGMLVPAVG